jgi:hypothetical protein
MYENTIIKYNLNLQPPWGMLHCRVFFCGEDLDLFHYQYFLLKFMGKNNIIPYDLYWIPILLYIKGKACAYHPKSEISLMLANTGLLHNYSIFLSGPHRAEVTHIYGGADPYIHAINLATSPWSCSRKFLECNECLCSQAIMFMRHFQLDPVNYMTLKYTVEGGITILRNSFGFIESQLSIQYDSLETSSLPVIPLIHGFQREDQGRSI